MLRLDINHLRSSSRLSCPLGFWKDWKPGFMSFSLVFRNEDCVGNIGWLNTGFLNPWFSTGNLTCGFWTAWGWLLVNWKRFCRLNAKLDPKFEPILGLKASWVGDGLLELNPNSPITADSGSDSLSALICRSSKSWNATSKVKSACKSSKKYGTCLGCFSVLYFTISFAHLSNISVTWRLWSDTVTDITKHKMFQVNHLTRLTIYGSGRQQAGVGEYYNEHSGWESFSQLRP